ncbi:MAG: Ycf51 family protein [Pegethrix bostrychoides GSE-TBD4-15B]|jgi:hypothetical protein|uniref:Ycf51 family protein n=1 Tax=Pegethrix bostrychoides GSE-TBD4-15B TaxID=2839662 RepID=A0A951U597_9CYAN|nr:Ycf51 family protein [Pegethrix bostrychoides GSE-TBD4-15B]
MFTPASFFTYTQWSGIATLAFAALTLLSFLLGWGIRFRLVGATGLLGVLTAGLFGLSVVPFSRAVVPGAARYSTVYDSGATQVVIAVAPSITAERLEATLRQAASDLFSSGRLSRGESQLTIRARTVLHPEPGLSEPLYLGQVKRSLFDREDAQMVIELRPDSLAKLPPAEQPVAPSEIAPQNS